MLNLVLGIIMIGYVYQDADSLLVMGNDSLTIGGFHQYNLKVHVWSGAKLIVRTWTGVDTTGWLTLSAPFIDLHSVAVVTAAGRGYWGGNNSHPSGYGTGFGVAGGLSGGGGGAGAYGGNGGQGGDQYPGSGGTAYGSASDTIIDMGSGGGAGRLSACDGLGGNGGGAVYLRGRNVTMDSAQIVVHGNAGFDGSLEAGGAGAGGGIMIRADTVRLWNAIFNAGGGAGGNADFGGGGGGGGGRIKVFFSESLDTLSLAMGCPFGAGGTGQISNGVNGDAGTIYIGPLVSVAEFDPLVAGEGFICSNPSGGLFTINNPGAEPAKIAICDILGRVRLSGILRSGKNTVRLDGLPNGVYLVLIEGRAGGKKLVVVR